jgi:benzil reductase ((S)-benzoin forming)
MKLAVVSGGSRGLGEALCRRYLDAGFQVLEFSRSAPHDFSVAADFAQPEQAVSVLARELASLAHLEFDEIVVISNAGTVEPVGPTSRKSPADILASLNVNIGSAVLFITEALRQFQRQPCKKTIVQISSGAALRPYFGWSLYCSAKACLDTFIRTLALEQGGELYPFHAISFEPGVIDTEMQAVIRDVDRADFPDLDRFRELHKNQALRAPEQVAELLFKIVERNSGNGLRYDIRDIGI